MPAKTKDKAMQLQSVYYGDCVKHLTQWNAHNFELLPSARGFADLIYLDPPWNSNADYNILWDKGAHADKGFTAQETGSLAYLAYMAERLAFCRELLKDTGSIYLHCDPTMSHYLKKT